MPFRHANAYGGYDYPAFPPAGGFDFIDYDAGTDPLMSPYDAFSLANPPEIAWTPTSQEPESQHSDSLSPLELNFVTSENVSPSSQEEPVAQQLPLDAAPATVSASTSAQTRDLPLQQDTRRQQQPQQQVQQAQQQVLPDLNLRTLSQNSSQFWAGAVNPLAATTVPKLENANSVSPPVTAPVRQGSADSSSETSDTGRVKVDRSEPTRTRTTDSAKVRHNIVERRYRENINAQVDVLRDSIVATMEAKSSRLGADELKRLTKAAVIAAATQQIKRARTENDKLLDEHRILQAQIKELESLVKCGECPLMQLSVDMGLESPTQQA